MTKRYWVEMATVDGDLYQDGTRNGGAFSREAAWGVVKHYRGIPGARYVRVMRGCVEVWRVSL